MEVIIDSYAKALTEILLLEGHLADSQMTFRAKRPGRYTEQSPSKHSSSPQSPPYFKEQLKSIRSSEQPSLILPSCCHVLPQAYP